MQTMLQRKNNTLTAVQLIRNMALIIISIKPLNSSYFTIICAHSGSATY